MSDPRLWARYQLRADLELFVYGGIYHQAPLATQLDANVGNPALTPERATQTGAGSVFRYGEWSLRLEGYLQRRSSIPFNGTPSLTTAGQVYYPLLVNSGISRSIGMEVLLRRELSAKIYGWISYTLSRSQQLERPGLPWEPTDYDQPNILTLLVAYRQNTKAELSVRFRYASGNPLRGVTGSVFDSSTGNYLPVNTPFGAARLPAFMQLDFQMNNVWTSASFMLTMYIELQNLLGRNNAEGAAYNFNYQQIIYVPGQPLNASVGAKLSW
jgi:outer membrane receptor protein involved in Fe transport